MRDFLWGICNFTTHDLFCKSDQVTVTVFTSLEKLYLLSNLAEYQKVSLASHLFTPWFCLPQSYTMCPEKQIVEKSICLHFVLSCGSQWDHFGNAMNWKLIFIFPPLDPKLRKSV